MGKGWNNGGRTYAVGKPETDADLAARLAAARERDRLDCIARLERIDANGCWSDEECAAGGIPPMTLEEAREALARLESGGWDG